MPMILVSDELCADQICRRGRENGALRYEPLPDPTRSRDGGDHHGDDGDDAVDERGSADLGQG